MKEKYENEKSFIKCQDLSGASMFLLNCGTGQFFWSFGLKFLPKLHRCNITLDCIKKSQYISGFICVGQ